MSEVWDGSESQAFGTAAPESRTFVRVNNSSLPLQPGISFASAIKEAAKRAGLGKFRVYLNGSEVLPSNAPDTVQEGMAVELRPYDVAG